MKRKHGFTLIELLAVIVVLAIIALIATPIVLNIINKAKEGAAEQSAVAYINAIENYMVLSLLNPDEYPLKLEKGKTYQISEDIYEITYDTYSLIPVVYAEEETKDYVEGIYVGDYVYVKGTYPESGVITIGESGIIETATMSIGGYITECEQKKCEVIGKDRSDIIKVKEVKITDKSITELEVGETLELSATVKPDNATNKKISWLSSNPTIATVENGVVTANSVGTVTIVAKTGSKTDSIELNVYKKNESILEYLETKKLKNDSIVEINVNNKTYSAHVYNYEGNQTWNEEKIFGDSSDVATETEYAKNMVIVKVNGDLTIGESGFVRPYYTEYGGPKGFLLYVTGTLTNNGTIDNSHGAKAIGEDVYLWKNEDGSYEYVPAIGGTGGVAEVINSNGDIGKNGTDGGHGIDVSKRATAGGGSGATVAQNSNAKAPRQAGNGSDGTSYSGGTGGASLKGNNSCIQESGYVNGGAGGSSICDSTTSLYSMGGGAGNPGGKGKAYQTFNSNLDGKNGTGGLLIIYSNVINSTGNITANGSQGGGKSGVTSHTTGGAGSGGGSINIFYKGNSSIDGKVMAIGGEYGYSNQRIPGNGGDGTVTIGSISTGNFVEE